MEGGADRADRRCSVTMERIISTFKLNLAMSTQKQGKLDMFSYLAKEYSLRLRLVTLHFSSRGTAPRTTEIPASALWSVTITGTFGRIWLGNLKK